MSSTAAQRRPRKLRAASAAATVVVQYVDVEDSGYVDVVGSPTLLIRTVGSGPAVVLRDGVGYDATWSRPFPLTRTSFSGANKLPIPFAPGPVRVLLVNANPVVSPRASRLGVEWIDVMSTDLPTDIAASNPADENATGTARVKRGMAEMLKGGVIMDVARSRRASPRTPAQSPSWHWSGFRPTSACRAASPG